MKIVKEHINEKFKPGSDPIEDMGIGMKAKMREEFDKLESLRLKHSYVPLSSGVIPMIEYLFNAPPYYEHIQATSIFYYTLDIIINSEYTPQEAYEYEIKMHNNVGSTTQLLIINKFKEKFGIELQYV